jgi:hypothetical protein
VNACPALKKPSKAEDGSGNIRCLPLFVGGYGAENAAPLKMPIGYVF